MLWTRDLKAAFQSESTCLCVCSFYLILVWVVVYLFVGVLKSLLVYW